MLHQVISAGFGGQGVLLLGQALAYAGMLEEKEVSWYPSYGPEMRGGTANCTTVISDSRIGSPVVSNPSALIAMNRPSLEKFQHLVEPGGLIIYNSSFIREAPARADVKAIGIKAQELAGDIGNTRVANIVLLGALLKLANPVEIQSIEEALKMILPARRHDLLPMNYEALRKGAELVG